MTDFQTEMHRLLVIPARDRNAADKLTLTLHGPQTADRGRLIKVLAHLLSSNQEWDADRPNVDLVVTMEVGPSVPYDAADDFTDYGPDHKNRDAVGLQHGEGAA